MGEDIILLHPELTGDCKDYILQEFSELDKLKSEMADLSMKRFELEKEYNRRSKVLSSMHGVVFDVITTDKPKEYTVSKSNILFQNVNGGSKSW